MVNVEVFDHSIGAVARAAGVGVEAVQFYERHGLLNAPARSPSGCRWYPMETIARLRFIRRAKELGFTLQEVGDLLSLGPDGGAGSDEVARVAVGKLADVEQRIGDLQRMAGSLRALVAVCRKGGPEGESNPLLEALAESRAA